MNILYFASLKEAIGCANEQMSIDDGMTVASLRAQLIKRYGSRHFPNHILCAVNQVLADDAIQLKDNDEVAFYPPVTGG